MDIATIHTVSCPRTKPRKTVQMSIKIKMKCGKDWILHSLQKKRSH